MNKRYIVRLTADERKQLERIISKGRTVAYRVKHAHILLKSDADGPNWTDERIAEAFSVYPQTVAGVRQRFVEEGFEAALGRRKQNRPSKPPKFDGEKEARLIALSCSKPPEGYGRWSLRLLADKAVELEIIDSVCHETIRRVLKKTSSSRTSRRCG